MPKNRKKYEDFEEIHSSWMNNSFNFQFHELEINACNIDSGIKYSNHGEMQNPLRVYLHNEYNKIGEVTEHHNIIFPVFQANIVLCTLIKMM